MLGVGALPVQGDSARADFPRAAVDGVEGVPRADGVHHCPVFPVVGVHRQDLQTADGGTLTGFCFLVRLTLKRARFDNGP